MTAIRRILASIDHRPWKLPVGQWKYYQEWNNVLFLHWRVPPSLLYPLIPKNTRLDIFEGQAWISLVPFTMEKIRPRNLPAWHVISTFHEINIRTYVTANNKPGVYFLNIEASKSHAAWVSRLLSGLPYEKAVMQRLLSEKDHHYVSINRAKGFTLEANFTVDKKINPSPLDTFLTERYCLYQSGHSYDVHHLPWTLYDVNMKHLTTQYKIGDIPLNKKPDLMHFSPGVQVLAWGKETIENTIPGAGSSHSS